MLTTETTADEIQRVARDMVDTGEISAVAHEVWRLMSGLDVLRDADGEPEKGFAICRRYGVGTRTLQKWAAAVRVAIKARREQIQSGDVRWGHSLASGADVRWGKDGTPIGDTGGSSWNPDRIKAAMAGTQRKQGKLPVKVAKGKRKERPAA